LTVELWDEYMQIDSNLVVHPQSGNVASTARDQERRAKEGPSDASAANSRRTQIVRKESSSGSQQDGTQPLQRVQLPPISQIGDLSRQGSPAVAAPAQGSEQNRGTITRNLIGALAASASRLQDTDNIVGIWFILSDLSVRTEGVFRLKFSLFNLTLDQKTLMDKGSSAVVCTTFSEPFTVYSAKRFPGMIESTELSRCFASQGVKLAVRNETRKG
jgi:hypothetical protein